MRRRILHEAKIIALCTALGMAVFGSMLLFGLRAKACEVRDGVRTPVYAELITMDRAEREALRNAAAETVVSEVVEQLSNNSPEVGNNFGELDLLAAIIYAEAGDQSFEGMRLVGDCIMNRVRSGQFPDTVAGVVYQPGQFSPVTDGGLDRAWGNVSAACYEAARLALSGEHLDTNVLYFSMYGCANGEFAYQVGDHYFGY